MKRYIVAVAAFLLGYYVRDFLNDWLLAASDRGLIIFLPGTLLVAYFFGIGPAILTALLSILASWYVFLPPYYSFALDMNRAVSLISLVAGTAVCIALVHLLRAATTTAQTLSRQRDADAGAMARLESIGNLCLRADYPTDECLKEILDAALDFTGAQKGNLQLFKDGALIITAQRGFEPPFLNFFARVDMHEAASCGAAFQAAERVIVENVISSHIFAGQPSCDVLLAAGVRAVQSTPLKSSSGKILGMISTHFSHPHRPSERDLGFIDLLARLAGDYLERQQAEQALNALATELRNTTETLATGLTHCSRDLRYLSANPAYAELAGVPREQIVGRPIVEVMGERAFETIRPYMDRVLRGERVEYEDELPWIARGPRWLHVIYTPYREEDGEISGWVASVTDISDRKHAEERLRDFTATLEQKVQERTAALQKEVWERRKAETTLERLQRLEAVGQLTGGIAHDFNNLLMVISNQAEAISRAAEGNDRIRKMAAMSLRAADRGAQLTSQLLSFAGHQTLLPITTAVDQLLRRIGKLLTRTIGENVLVQIVLGPELWLVHLDVAQCESAILNLAINARDAMPDGGRLTIRAENASLSADEGSRLGLTPGDYVAISVADVGIGMSPEVQQRAFEPFYTTKEVGKGTGLGLSQVYGFARQSDGMATIESAPGKGTTVVLYLPRATGAIDEAQPSLDQPQDRGARQPRRILLVEDQADVRQVTEEMLADLGHLVVTVADALAARSQLEGSDTIDLLLADIMLPHGMSGLELAREAQQIRPNLRIVLMSGYAREIRNDDTSLAGVRFLGKPFRQAKLASVIDAMFDGATEASKLVQRAPGKYRLLFFDEGGATVGHDEFEAEDDPSASVVAHVLQDACSDGSARFELWQDATRVGASSHGWSPTTREQINARTQQVVLEREHALFDSGMAIATSKRLLAETQRLLEEIETVRPDDVPK